MQDLHRLILRAGSNRSTADAMSASFLCLWFLLLAFELFPFLVFHHPLNGPHIFRPLFAEPLKIVVLYEYRQRRLPKFLFMVIQFAEFLRIHPKFASHLNLGMGKLVSLPRINPLLVFGRKIFPFRHIYSQLSIHPGGEVSGKRSPIKIGRKCLSFVYQITG